METRKLENGWLLRLLKGEKIIESLSDFIKQQDIGGGSITGIGAVCNSELGFFNRDKKEYARKLFPDTYELVNLTGNISWIKDVPFAHCHVTISGPDYKATAGHLFEAEIAVTGEIYIYPNKVRVDRKFDDDTGLNLINLK